MAEDSSSRALLFWVVTGGLILGVAAGWTILSRDFVFGEGHASRPILVFLVAYLVGWLVLVAGWMQARHSGAPPLMLVVAVGIGARALLWPSALIQENDVYRYVLDGQVLLNGGNPYSASPLLLAESDGGQTEGLVASPEARRVLDRISHSHIRTIYPPAAQLAFAAGAAGAGWNWKGQRAVFLAVEGVAVVLLLLLMTRIGVATGWVFLYAWNPLVLKEIANSAHLDVLVLLWIAAAIVALEKSAGSRGRLWAAAGGAALGMAVLSKLYPVVVLPAVYFWARRRIGSPAILVPVFAAVVTISGYLPFLSVGLEGLTAGPGAYTADWNANQGAFALLWGLTGSRPAAYLLVGLLAAAVPLWLPAGSLSDLGRRLFVSLLIWFLLIPAPFPWYAVPVVGLGLLGADRMSGVAALLVSGPVAGYYLRFFFEYHRFGEGWWLATRILEHGLIWVGLLALVLLRDRLWGRGPSFVSGGTQPTSPAM